MNCVWAILHLLPAHFYRISFLHGFCTFMFLQTLVAELVGLQDLHSRNLKNNKFSHDDDIPSAPPFCGGQEIKEGAQKAFGMHEAAGPENSHGLYTNNDPNKIKNATGVELKDNSGDQNPDKFVRSVKLFK